MRLDQNPLFRKVIVPWYDSEAVCGFVIFLMFIVFLFSLSGVSVARKTFEYHEMVWVPVLLLIMSGGVIVSTAFRMIRRYIEYRFSR